MELSGSVTREADVMTGEASYIELGVRDADAARAFYGRLLGWQASGDRGPGQVDSLDAVDRDPRRRRVLDLRGLLLGRRSRRVTGAGRAARWARHQRGERESRLRSMGRVRRRPGRPIRAARADVRKGRGRPDRSAGERYYGVIAVPGKRFGFSPRAAARSAATSCSLMATNSGDLANSTTPKQIAPPAIAAGMSHTPCRVTSW